MRAGKQSIDGRVSGGSHQAPSLPVLPKNQKYTTAHPTHFRTHDIHLLDFGSMKEAGKHSLHTSGSPSQLALRRQLPCKQREGMSRLCGQPVGGTSGQHGSSTGKQASRAGCPRSCQPGAAPVVIPAGLAPAIWHRALQMVQTKQRNAQGEPWMSTFHQHAHAVYQARPQARSVTAPEAHHSCRALRAPASQLLALQAVWCGAAWRAQGAEESQQQHVALRACGAT